MSTIDIAYLGLVLFAFIGFAAVLAFYSQTCAGTRGKESDAGAKRANGASAH
jgi:hypothetical protein